MIWGLAIGGALFLSGCASAPASLRDTVFVATRPLELALWFLTILTIALAGWWIILRLSAPTPPRRLFWATLSTLILGLLLASAPTLMLVTGIVWPSVVAIFQMAGFGGFLVGTALLVTAVLAVWRVIAALVDRF